MSHIVKYKLKSSRTMQAMSFNYPFPTVADMRARLYELPNLNSKAFDIHLETQDGIVLSSDSTILKDDVVLIVKRSPNQLRKIATKTNWCVIDECREVSSANNENCNDMSNVECVEFQSVKTANIQESSAMEIDFKSAENAQKNTDHSTLPEPSPSIYVGERIQTVLTSLPYHHYNLMNASAVPDGVDNDMDFDPLAVLEYGDLDSDRCAFEGNQLEPVDSFPKPLPVHITNRSNVFIGVTCPARYPSNSQRHSNTFPDRIEGALQSFASATDNWSNINSVSLNSSSMLLADVTNILMQSSVYNCDLQDTMDTTATATIGTTSTTLAKASNASGLSIVKVENKTDDGTKKCGAQETKQLAEVDSLDRACNGDEMWNEKCRMRAWDWSICPFHPRIYFNICRILFARNPSKSKLLCSQFHEMPAVNGNEKTTSSSISKKDLAFNLTEVS